MTEYPFNSSQDVINLQTKYSLFSRVANIVFSLSFDNKISHDKMTNALRELVARNDCLRIRFIKKDGKTVQSFDAERHLGEIPYINLTSEEKRRNFLKRFRRKMINPWKGEVLSVVFANEPDGKDAIYFKISHYVADTYAIGILIRDLMGVYNALVEEAPLPDAPGKFEDVLKKDIAYKENQDAVKKDREFYEHYYNDLHPAHPMYCGLHGDNSSIWMKQKRKGAFSIKYLFVKCDTEGYMAPIPSQTAERVRDWCSIYGISMSAFYFYAYVLASSVVNGKEPNQAPLMLLDCRGSLAERRCGGTKVQALSVYSSIDYSKSFNDNITAAYAEQNELYRHTRLTYLDVEAIQHGKWGHSMLSQVTNFSFSFIPFENPEGVTMQVHSNGKGALPAYIALMCNASTGEVRSVYDVQTEMITEEQLMAFHNKLINVIDKVTERPEEILNNILV